MNRIIISLLLLLLNTVFSINAIAQNKQLTIDEAVVGIYRELYPEYISNLQLRPNSSEVSYVEDNALYIKKFTRSKTKEAARKFLSIEEINQIVSNVEPKISYENFPKYKWLNNSQIEIQKGFSKIVIDITKKQIVEKTIINTDENWENFTYSPKNGNYCYTLENNLFVFNSKTNTTENISNDSDKNLVYGQTVSRNEFGIDGGIFWSPDGKKLAFYRKDESNVSEYPIVNTQTRIATEEAIKYPMAGEKSEKVSIGIYDLETQKTIYLKTGEIEEKNEYYLPCVTWSPDGKYLYAAKLNHKQYQYFLLSFNISNGDIIKTIIEETSNRYVEPSNPLLFLPNDPTKFIWQSRKDGYNHLYLYSIDGKLIRQLTKGNFEVQEVYGISPSGAYVFFKANRESAIDFDIYRVSIANASILRLTKDKGSHNASFSPDFKYFIDNYSNVNTPNVYNVMNIEAVTIETLLQSKNPLADYEMPDCKISTIKSKDGKTDLYYRLITPKNLDQTKKYPCIVYVYGGPHAQLITNRWLGGAAGWEYYMAQQGYIVFCLDNRGSANRGFEFESIIHRNVGKAEVEDQLSGIEFLRSLGYIDMNRIGVHGWSYGGFMTTTLICDYPEIFKVGVAGGPVINWELYEVMYGERYMDSPDENPDGYKNNNLLNKAKNLEGRLMLIHGAIDNVVVWQHSQNFIDECIKNKVLIDYMIYPSHEHNVRGFDRIHLMRTVTRYFQENL